uniref:CCD27 protein n=1 Tax=Echinostoma caproni TaxID=27848 RepID=A0A183B0Q3_9TREM
LTIHCAERGLLLLRVRNEVDTTLAALQSIYASGVVFGLQKSLAREADRNRQTVRIQQLEQEIAQLRKKIQIEALNCRALEEKEANRLAAATRRAEDDVNFLRKGHDQLKAQLEDILNQFKLVAP